MLSWNKMQVGAAVCKPGIQSKIRFDIMPFGLFLMIRTDEPSAELSHGITKGFAQFRAIMVDDYVVFLARFGMCPWMSAYFHRAAATYKTPPIPAGSKGIPLHIILVDAASGAVRARRVSQLDSRLSHKLFGLINSQDSNEVLRNEQIMINRIKFKYSTTQLSALASLKWRTKSY